MGRGDTKTTRGKIFKGSFGVWRPKPKKKTVPKKDAPTQSGSKSSR
jgi:ribosomal small subunit protein bTHX